MIDAEQLHQQVIRPVLSNLGLPGGVYAEAMVLGTACQESRCGLWLVQLNDGPARGIYQMEPATHDDLWCNFIMHRPDLIQKVNRWRIQAAQGMSADELTYNLAYATVMCRIHYYRVPAPLPDTLPGQAAYWKKYYNTELGAGTTKEYLDNWQKFASSILQWS